MKYIVKRAIIIKSLIVALGILAIKNFLFKNLSVLGQDWHDLIELSDSTIVFTGTFFVFGLLLAATVRDTSTQSLFIAIDKPRLWYPQNGPNKEVDCIFKLGKCLSVVIKRDVAGLHWVKKNFV